MRNKLTAFALALVLCIGPSLMASPRGGRDSGFDWNPLSRIAKIVKKIVLRVMDEPQQPPPAPHP